MSRGAIKGEAEYNDTDRHARLSLVTTYRIEKRVAEQFEAFMSGFNELIPQELINVFDERELEVSFQTHEPVELDAGC